MGPFARVSFAIPETMRLMSTRTGGFSGRKWVEVEDDTTHPASRGGEGERRLSACS